MDRKRLYRVTVVEGTVETTLNYRGRNKKEIREKAKRDMVGHQKIKEISIVTGDDNDICCMKDYLSPCSVNLI